MRTTKTQKHNEVIIIPNLWPFLRYRLCFDSCREIRDDIKCFCAYPLYHIRVSRNSLRHRLAHAPIGGHDFLIKFSVLTYDRAYHYLSAVFNGFENTFISLVEYRHWIVAKIANFSGQSKVQRRFLKITKMVNNHFRTLPRVY